MPIAIAALGIILIVVEEVRLQIYLDAPCPEGVIACDKVIGRDYGTGMILLVAAGIIFGVERVIRPPATLRT